MGFPSFFFFNAVFVNVVARRQICVDNEICASAADEHTPCETHPQGLPGFDLL